MQAGKIKETVKSRSVLKRIQKRRTEVIKGAGRDSRNVQMVFGDSLVSVLSDTVFVPEKILETERGSYVQVQAASLFNAVYSEGFAPSAMTAVMILSGEAKEASLRFLVDCLEELAGREQTELADVSAECSPEGQGAWISLTIFGEKKASEESKGMGFLPGREIVMAGTAALEGAVMLENLGREELSERFSGRFLETVQEYPDRVRMRDTLEFLKQEGLGDAVYCAGRSGVFGALWEIAGKAKSGFAVELSEIPITQETVEICEFFDVNPYLLRSGGALFIAAEHGRIVADKLRERQIPAAVIGSMEENADKLVFNGGERRYLDMPCAVKIGRNMDGLEWIY